MTATWRAWPAASGLVLGPERIQVWREVEDLAGRTVMRNGAWVV